LGLLIGIFGGYVLEGLWAVLLSTVVFGTGLGALSTNGAPQDVLICYIFALFVSVVGLCSYRYFYLYRYLGHSLYATGIKRWYGFIVFLLFYLGLYALVMRWPDFFPLGERLRDYAVLHSVSLNPVSPVEPWAPPFPLYYYVWWYRFAAMLGQAMRWTTFELYHAMVCLPLALLAGVVFSLCQRIFNGSLIFAGLATVLCCCGSNIAGIKYFFADEGWNWWGPSRVITGAINEFPVWSFLLGDVHPHYLNIAIVPLAVLWCVRLIDSKLPIIVRSVFTCSITLVTLFWLRGANAWEMPLWLLLVGIATSIIVALFFLKTPVDVPNPAQPGLRDWLKLHCEPVDFGVASILFLCALVASVILYVLQEPVKAGDVAIEWVKKPIALTRQEEGWLHWGGPLTMILVLLPLQVRSISTRILIYFFYVVMVLCEVIYPLWAFLFFIFAYNLLQYRRNQSFDLEDSREYVPFVLLSTFGLLSLALLLLPEIVFLNDAYGGENERMNTIFKVYSFLWTPFHIWAVGLLYWAVSQGPLRVISAFPKILNCLLLFILTGLYLLCSVRIIFEEGVRTLPSAAHWDREGLGKVEETFPGARDTIRALRTAERGLVLEAQDGAYNWSSHIATLSGQFSYLGWRNHVDLLTRDVNEGARREEVTARIYQATDCTTAYDLAKSNAIRYIVVGPIEQRRYNVKGNLFNCLQLISAHKNYHVFSVSD
jgi:uncharacterized membrane protein